jgi:hypothetical protein
MAEPRSVVGLAEYRRQTRPAAAVGTSWCDRRRFDPHQFDNRETARQLSSDRPMTSRSALTPAGNGADSYQPRRGQIPQSEALASSSRRRLGEAVAGPPQHTQRQSVTPTFPELATVSRVTVKALKLVFTTVGNLPRRLHRTTSTSFRTLGGARRQL